MARRLFLLMLGLAAAVTLLATPALARQLSPLVNDRLLEALALVEDGEPQRALEAMEALSGRVRAGSIEALVITQQHAAVLAELGRLAEARELLERALDDEPGAPSADLRRQLGVIQAQDGDFEAADSSLTRWLALQPRPAPQDLFLAGYVRFYLGDHTVAADLMGRALAAASFVPAAWLEVQVLALAQAGRSGQAEILLRERIADFPQEAQWWRLMASLALEEERVEAAAAHFAIANTAETPAAADIARLVDLLAAAGQPARAARLQARLLAGVDSGRAAPLLKLARLWIAAREWEEAQSVLEDATALPNSAEAFRLLGQVHLHWERYAQALEALEASRVREEGDDAADTAWLLAIAAWNFGSFDVAREALQVARQSERHRAQADRLLRQLPGQ